MNHELKTDPEPFNDIIEGRKTFEIRWNDRNFQVGDRLILRQTKHTAIEMLEGAPLIYTGAFWSVDVIGILHGPAYGIDKGYCVMSLKTYCEEAKQ